MRRAVLATLVGLAACRPPEHRNYGFDRPGAPPPEPPAAASAAPPHVSHDSSAVRAAARPLHAVRPDGSQLAADALWSDLARARAVCFGERHDDAADHAAALELLTQVARRATYAGRELALGLEMVDASRQPALDHWQESSGDDDALDALARESDWIERWGYDFGLYRPLFDVTRTEHLGLLGLNARREVTRAVAQHGTEQLEPELRAELPELDLGVASHRAAFDAALRDHPGAPSGDRAAAMYAAQVVWDETMATRAATWLARRNPARIVIVLAGRGHCRRDAVPARIARRLPGMVVAVAPVDDEDAATPRADDGYDFGLVRE